jgi:predicted kinase
MTESDPGSGPRLFLMCGLPGAGKTTRAKELEKEHHAVRLTPDDWLLAIHLPDWTRGQRSSGSIRKRTSF